MTGPKDLAPIDMHMALEQLDGDQEFLYEMLEELIALMPEQINDKGFHRIRNFRDYDNRYTAPLHGFKDAEDYWNRCSSRQFIPSIRIPALIVNARNDPFLGEACYPFSEVSDSSSVSLETPLSGGHVGFVQFNREDIYWSEERSVEFLESN